MDGVRTGPKKIKSTVVTTVKNTGSFGKSETPSAHKSCKAPNSGPGGAMVHGKPLFSEAANKVED